MKLMPKGNPNPVQTDAFKARWFKRGDETSEPLAEKLTCVRLTESVYQALQALPNKSAWIRRVITEAAERELMGNDEQQ
jgi:hypothetical protein